MCFDLKQQQLGKQQELLLNLFFLLAWAFPPQTSPCKGASASSWLWRFQNIHSFHCRAETLLRRGKHGVCSSAAHSCGCIIWDSLGVIFQQYWASILLLRALHPTFLFGVPSECLLLCLQMSWWLCGPFLPSQLSHSFYKSLMAEARGF